MMQYESEHLGIYLGENTVGWFVIDLDIIARKRHLRSLVLHFFIKERKDWKWGYEESWYDGPICEIKLGPFARIFWM